MGRLRNALIIAAWVGSFFAAVGVVTLLVRRLGLVPLNELLLLPVAVLWLWAAFRVHHKK